MSRENVPWYKWRFTLGGVYVVLLLLYVAWNFLSDVESPVSLHISAGVFFLDLAILIAVLERRNRQPVTFTLRKTEESNET